MNMVSNGYNEIKRNKADSSTLMMKSCFNSTSSTINNNNNENQNEMKFSDSKFVSSNRSIESRKPYRLQIVWRNVFLMVFLHISALYGFYLFWLYAKYQTLLYLITSVFICGLGVTCGAHRLWAHRSYEASLPLRIILMLLNSASLQNDIYEWCRDHRVHHKFSETDADPHNSRRGFFFAHIGWLLCRKHPDVFEKGKTVSMVDVEQDPVVQFQRLFYKPLAVFLTFCFPTWIPYFFWDENLYTSYFLTMTKYTFILHGTWLVNSAAHLYGKRLYDTTISPVESQLVELFSLGEGYHNYHHVFPYDYSASEMSWTRDLNFSTLFIDFCAWLGLAWNLKKVDPKLVMQRVHRTGNVQMVEIYHQQQQRSWWRHTIIPVILYITMPVFGIFIFRQSLSYIYFLYTGIENKWP